MNTDPGSQDDSPPADPDEAQDALPAESIGNESLLEIEGATVDLGRESRCGFAEVIFGEGKPADLIQRIIESQIAADQCSLVTRIVPTVAAQLSSVFDGARHNAEAKTLRVHPAGSDGSISIPHDAKDPPRHVAVVTAGSTDAPVAAEAVETLSWMGIPYREFTDIGVAGPQRLLSSVDNLRQADAAVVIAGMEGALPAVVGGHLSVPVFAVPTSVGYGISLGGLTAMFGMLSSCASNVAVVNIDAGFKGAYLAGLVVHRLMQAAKP